MNGSSQFVYCPNFSNLTVPQAVLSNAIISTTAALCFLGTVLVLLVLLLYKAYRTALQRAFFHYVLTTSLSLASTALMVELQFDVTSEFCNWLAFFKEWWYLTSHLFTVGVVVAIIISAYNKIRPMPSNSTVCSKNNLLALELILSIFAFIFPLSYLWRPMRVHHFGLVGSTCWIKVYNETCRLVGDGEVVFSLVIMVLEMTVSLLYSVLLVVLHLFIIKKYKQNRRSRLKFLCRALFLLLICDISTVRVAIDHAMSIQKISQHLNQVVYITIDNCLENILAVLLAVAFGLYIYSPSKLKWVSLKQAIAEFFTCCSNGWHSCCFKPHRGSSSSKRSRRYHNDNSNTFEASAEHFVPSHTTYTVPYTNEFTEVTEILTKEKIFPWKYGST